MRDVTVELLEGDVDDGERLHVHPARKRELLHIASSENTDGHHGVGFGGEHPHLVVPVRFWQVGHVDDQRGAVGRLKHLRDPACVLPRKGFQGGLCDGGSGFGLVHHHRSAHAPCQETDRGGQSEPTHPSATRGGRLVDLFVGVDLHGDPIPQLTRRRYRLVLVGDRPSAVDDGTELIDLRLTRNARPHVIVISRRHTLPEGEERDRVFVHVTHLLVVSGISIALMLRHRPPPIDRGAGPTTGVCDS